MRTWISRFFGILSANDLLPTDAFRHLDRGAVTQIPALAIAENRFPPFAAEADAREPRVSDGKAVVRDSTANAPRTFADVGFPALPFPEARSGLQATRVLRVSAVGLCNAVNLSVTNYAMLTIAAAKPCAGAWTGPPDLKARFLVPVLYGHRFGPRCLSEPRVGSSLADIQTVAEQGNGGAYRPHGSKMWISGMGRGYPGASSTWLWPKSREYQRVRKRFRCFWCRNVGWMTRVIRHVAKTSPQSAGTTK